MCVEAEIMSFPDDTTMVVVKYKWQGKQYKCLLKKTSPYFRPCGWFMKCLAWKRCSYDQRLKAEKIDANAQTTRRHQQ